MFVVEYQVATKRVIKSAVFFAAHFAPFTKPQAAYSVLFIYNACGCANPSFVLQTNEISG
jgi:hypothetical protein